MPVLARCPLCRAVLHAESADAPAEVRCPRCAEMVVPNTRKLCARCSRDVTHEKRTRDGTGEYYCAHCWSEVAAESAGKGIFECAACGGKFAAHEVRQEGGHFICRSCRGARGGSPALLPASASGPIQLPTGVETFSGYQARQRRQRQVRTALWVVGATFLLAVIVAIALYAR